MNPVKAINLLKNEKYLIITPEELSALLTKAQVIIEKDTQISGKIRLLKLQDDLLIQEKSNKDEVLLRKMRTEKEGEEFIKQRMEIYDHMWDGCGCKVQYYD